MDMTKLIEPRSDQMNAEDLLSGPRTFTITDVREGSAEQRVRVFLAEFPQNRPWLPNVTMCRLMVLGWGPESNDWHGKRVTLYRDPDVRFGRDQPGGIRISHMSGIRRPITANLTVTKGRRGPYRVEPLTEDALPAKVPGPMDHLVWAMNAAKIPTDDRLAYCRGIIQRDIGKATDLTADEVATVIAALQAEPMIPRSPVPPGAATAPHELSDDEQAEAYEREQEARQAGD